MVGGAELVLGWIGVPAVGMGAGGGVWARLLGDGIKAGVVVLLSLLAGFFTAFPLG